MDNHYDQDVFRFWVITLAMMVLMALLTAAGYYIDTVIVQPAQRAHTLNDPNRTIALRQDFHNKLTEVLTANSNIQALAHKIQLNQKQVPGYLTSQQYQDDQSELEGLITIHTQAISGYNEQARGVDTSTWNDICMPHSIPQQTFDESDLPGMLDALHIEQQSLTAKDGVC